MGTVIDVSSGLPYDVYIGRRNNSYSLARSEWANPYPPSASLSRVQSLALYYWYLQTRPDLIERLGELRGRTLGCWCAPLACHGHLLAHLADGDNVPRPDAYSYWLECQQCGAPSYFWREDITDPAAFLLAGHRLETMDARHFRKLNGNSVGNGEIVGCMVCQSVGAYMLRWSQHRHGRLAEIANAKLSARQKLAGSIA